MNKVEEDVRPHVAVIDEDPVVGSSLVQGLTPLGFKVRAFADGALACEWLERERVDAIVMGLHLGSMSGWDLLERLRTRYPSVVAIVQSARVDVPTAVSAIRAGAFDVLEKPTRLTELQARLLEGILHRRSTTKPADAVANSTELVPAPVRQRRDGLVGLLGNSAALARVREQVRGIARFTQVSTLIVGETGTGKEVVAEALHALSAPDKPFVAINCAAIPDTLFESELFGHEAGAFTGARTTKPGLFETVGEGTLLLDEVGEMSMTMQPKLLRVLQNRTFRRVGGNRDIDLRARIVSATNRKLSAERQDGMRSDLYFRLAGFTIVLPPLRHRPEDIDLLANHFLLDFAAKYPGVPTRISASAAELMLSYPWRGNVRELKRVVEQAAVLCSGSVLGDDAVARALDERHGAPPTRFGTDGREAPSVTPPVVSPRSDRPGPVSTSWTRSLDAMGPSERRAVDSSTSSSGVRALGLADDVGLNAIQQRLILDAYEANSRNLSRAARALRIPRTTLRDRLKRYGCL